MKFRLVLAYITFYCLCGVGCLFVVGVGISLVDIMLEVGLSRSFCMWKNWPFQLHGGEKSVRAQP